MSAKGFRLLTLTYNIAQTQGKGAKTLPKWLDVGDKLPDFVVIGLQETAPLYFALLGLNSATLSAYEEAVKKALGDDGAKYKTLAKTARGGNGLIVLVREGSPSKAVVDVHTSTASCGFIFMSNKGAVGARISLAGERGDESPALTFVTGHLAAHEHKLARRNKDWREIVARLTFSTKTGLKQIYDTSCLFVLGDLNYRIEGDKSGRKGAQHILYKLHNDLESLLPKDQLAREMKAGRTMHHLHEGTITFKPTYKMLKNELEGYKIKRIPSWCDRVLYATFDNRHTRLRRYTSHPKAIASDHKPVSAMFSLPPIEGRTPKLRHSAPFPVDGLAGVKSLIGRLLDTIIGLLWLIVATLGLGNDKAGLSAALVIALAVVYYQTR